MSPVETALRPAARVVRAVAAASLVLLMTAWGCSAQAGAAPAARPSRCEAPGKVYAQKVIVAREHRPVDLTTLFVVCRPTHVAAIVDSDGRTYEDLADFRAHNHLFSGNDKITLPRDFPSTDTTRRVELVTVSGHTGGSPAWWWATGALVLVLAAGGGLLLLRARRRSRPAAEAQTDAETEPSP